MSLFYSNCDWSCNQTENIWESDRPSVGCNGWYCTSSFPLLIFIQGEPNKNHASGEYHTPHDQSWSRSSCQLGIDSRFLFHSDLGPSWYNHPIAHSTAENSKLQVDILSFVEKLTFKLVRVKERAFKIHCIGYTHGNGMGKHADYFGIKLAKSGGYHVRLCISIGKPREITFSATLVNKDQIIEKDLYAQASGSRWLLVRELTCTSWPHMKTEDASSFLLTTRGMRLREIRNHRWCRHIAITSEGNQYLKILSRLFSRFLLEYILDRMHSTDRIE
jgi:hypothetical protein